MCSTQHNNKNELSMTQKETGKCSVHFETMAKQGIVPCVTVTQGYYKGISVWHQRTEEF